STFLNSPGTAFNFASGNTDSGTAYDPITQTSVTLGPIPDNQSTGNPNRDPLFNFGDRQGLAVYGGHVYAARSGHLHRGPDGKERRDILTATVNSTAGPRVIDSTQGPVGEAGDTVNTQRTADGGPEADSIIVTFDRPVDVSTFTPDKVTVQYRRPTTSGNAP